MQSEYATKSLYRDDAEVDGVRNDDVITASGKVLEKAHDIEYVATCYRVWEYHQILAGNWIGGSDIVDDTSFLSFPLFIQNTKI